MLSPNKPINAVSLDSVEQALAHWRKNKSSYAHRGIPDEVWLQIFELEGERYSAGRLRALFNLNSNQYKRKRELLLCKLEPALVSTSSVSQPDPEPSFVQVSVVNKDVPPLDQNLHATKSAIKSLKSTSTQPQEFLDPTTVIVECIRNDGHRLKIHTSNQRIEAIIHSFCQQGELT